jgi:murein DD-endopeptidase MepM/ murein hydrolase activator NlpD
MPPLRKPVLVVVVVLVVVALSCPFASPVDAVSADRYEPPSDAPIIDHFRPPSHRYGPGNRGIDYGTAAGDRITASRDGVVEYAGRVGGDLHLTILHPDGLRTTTAFADEVLVGRGDRVRRGQDVAVAGGPFHFGVRAGRGRDTIYLDPERLFAGGYDRARLVPTP